MNQAEQPNAQTLADAFLAFNRMSAALESSYRDLEQRAAALAEELAATRSERLALADRLETLLATLPGAVLHIDGDGRIREANAAARVWFGGELTGQVWQRVLSVRGARLRGNELALADGRRVSMARRDLAQGDGCILLLTDVTEQRQLEEALERQQRLSAIGEMAAGLAHQIRTPLSAALLYAGQLGHARLDAARQARFRNKLVERLRHLERLVNDMLAFARGGEVAQGGFALQDLVATLAARSEAALAAAGACLRCRLPDALAEFVLPGSVDMLGAALANLVENALQAGADAIEVTAGDDAGFLILEVADNGPGIAEADRERVFEPFYTTRSEGTGLGLAVVRNTVEAHGGRIRVRPAETGARFEIRLPRAAAEPLPTDSTTGMAPLAAHTAGRLSQGAR
ncbi:sensor histidine kinase [Thiohalobacter sp.]|uniref:sensor histidine kinase n=1 Tax=Thiohalobacter sp. TaxID=2025948 RepID=UPI00260ECA6D|nr:ATP-binding protein [Thiohalobacter sp.]